MQPTVMSDFCKTALKRLLVNNDTPNPKISPPQLQDAMNEFNLISDSWNTDGKTIYTQQFYNFPLANGTSDASGSAVYTIGPSNTASMNTGTQPRPSYLEFAAFEQTTSSPVVDLPMYVVEADEWASIITKNIQSSIAFYVYLDGNWPLGNLYIWPKPQVSANIVLTTWQSLNSNMTLQSEISLPPGYARALSLDLSIAMAPYYGKSGSAAVQQMGAVLANLKKNMAWVNLRGGRMRYSGDAQGSKGGAVYDAISDQKF